MPVPFGCQRVGARAKKKSQERKKKKGENGEEEAEDGKGEEKKTYQALALTSAQGNAFTPNARLVALSELAQVVVQGAASHN